MVAQREALSPDKTALAIFDDVLSDEPTYEYDLAEAGKYARQLEMLIQARKNENGLEIANRVLDAIKRRPDSELATLIKKREAAKNSPEDRVPALPPRVQLPEECLPKPLDDSKQDWFAAWDSSKLRKVSPFLADYIEYSNRVSPEGYIDFHIATALWVLSVVAARRIYVPLSQPVYSPFAIALVARTSLFAKSATANGGIKALKSAGLGWFLGDDETTPHTTVAL